MPPDIQEMAISPAQRPVRSDPLVLRGVVLLTGVLASGTLGYAWIEGWALWDAFFFTLVTLTTVGYGDYGLTAAGERFTALVMIGGIGTVSYTGGMLIQRLVVRASQQERKMIDQTAKLRNHFIVCGLGRTGLRVIDRLEERGEAAVAIDPDPERVAHARSMGLVALSGDATSDLGLSLVGIKHASAIAATTSSDAVNALICLSARAVNPEIRVVARAEDKDSVCKLERAGADAVISPSTYGGDGIAESMAQAEMSTLLPGLHGSDGSLHFAELAVRPGSTHIGRTLAEIGREHRDLVFVAWKDPSGECRVRPDPHRPLAEGDMLVIAGSASQLSTLRLASAA
ncbi:MAG: potassium channel protein [Planctomycetota bacterium]